jgi:hypothetical protein
MDEPSIAVMEALPAEVLHFINDLEDEIERLQFRVRHERTYDHAYYGILYWRDRAVSAGEVAVKLAHDVIAAADALRGGHEYPHQQQKYDRDTATARSALAVYDRLYDDSPYTIADHLHIKE